MHHRYLVELAFIPQHWTPGYMLEGGASGQNLVHYPKDRIYNGLYRENMKKIFLSETTRPRALIFGILYYLVDLLHIMSLGPKMGPPCGSHDLHRLRKGKHEKSFCLKPQDKEP